MLGLAGKTLGRYVLGQRIGKGGMADVYLAYDPHFQRAVAVKIFKQDSDGMLQRFMREAKLMASLHHPHLMPIYDTGESDIDGITRYYIVMPFVDGGTLGSRIYHSIPSYNETCNYLLDIASALDYIHEHGIIHRDIKSTNVLLSTDDLCYLSDLGVARLLNDAYTLTSTGNVLGTVDYIAPELFVGAKKADASSDIYSLGVLLFEMVTGQRPFAAENQVALASMHVNDAPPLARTLVPTISPAIERVLSDALEKDPARRFPTATALADAFYRATKMPPAFVPPPRRASVTPLQSAVSRVEISEQLTAKQASVSPITGDIRASVVQNTDAQGKLAIPPLSSTHAPKNKRKRILFALLIIVLFVISIPAAWFLGQLHTKTTNAHPRSSSISISFAGDPTAAVTTIATSTNKTVGSKPTSTPLHTTNPQPTFSQTPTSSSQTTPTPSSQATPIPSPITSATPVGTPVYVPPNLIQDPSYEMQYSNVVSSPWSSVGNTMINYGSGKAFSGSNSAQIIPTANNAWADIRQTVNVQPNTTYTLSVYILTSNFIDSNFALFDVNSTQGSNIGVLHYGPSPHGYNRLSFVFNSGSYTAVIVRIGFSGPTNAWVQADSWSLHS